MSDNPLVNGQIIDAVTGMVTLMSGQAPSQTFSMLDTVMVETLGMAMYNAVHRQQNGGMTSNAAVTAACAKMLSVPYMLPPSPPPAGPPTVPPLLGPPPPPPPPALPPVQTPMSEATALAQAQAGIAALRMMAQQSGAEARMAASALSELATLATVPQPAASSPSGPGNTGGGQPTATSPGAVMQQLANTLTSELNVVNSEIQDLGLATAVV